MKINNLIHLFIIFLSVVGVGCSNYTIVPTKTPAEISENPLTYLDLTSLPEPKGKIVVSVYNFRDQTGQYKPQENVSSFSTAVTQGALSMLVQVLNESGWFIPVEREGLQNVLTERKIIRAANTSENITQGNNLPPLLTSSVLLEGGIISYDTNIKTGGIGLGYYGFSANELHRTDEVTLYLRAVDVRNGRVLLSVSTSKKVFSQELHSGFFRYVSLSRLAEMEAGVTSNEPMHICVLQALQKAVVSLVIEGVQSGIWKLKRAKEIDSPVIRRYSEEKKSLLERLNKLGAE